LDAFRNWPKAKTDLQREVMEQPSERDDGPCESHKAFQKKSENEIDSVESAKMKRWMALVSRQRWPVSEKDVGCLSTFQKSE
jgi:hypothetical protein